MNFNNLNFLLLRKHKILKISNNIFIFFNFDFNKKFEIKFQVLFKVIMILTLFFQI